MTKSTAQEVYLALKTASLPISIVDGLGDICYFSSTVTVSAVRAILDPLEWTAAQILVLTELDSADPHTQYLTLSRHDQLIRHEIGVVVPRDTDYIKHQAKLNAIIYGGGD